MDGAKVLLIAVFHLKTAVLDLFLLRLEQDIQIRYWRTNLGEDFGNGQNPLVQLQLMKVSGMGR
jgi:hypothetical protein